MSHDTPFRTTMLGDMARLPQDGSVRPAGHLPWCPAVNQLCCLHPELCTCDAPVKPPTLDVRSHGVWGLAMEEPLPDEPYDMRMVAPMELVDANDPRWEPGDLVVSMIGVPPGWEVALGMPQPRNGPLILRKRA